MKLCGKCTMPGGKKRACRCGVLMCESCWDAHRCPALLAMTKASLNREDERERGVKLKLQQLLDELGMLWVRVNCGTVQVARGYMHGARKGWPDFLVFPDDGRKGAIETKATHGDECKSKTCGCAAQRDWRVGWERRGGFYILARTLDDVYAGLGLPLPQRQEALL